MTESNRRERSKQWYKRATAVTPGGVNSPVRAFRSVGEEPLFIKQGEGPYVTDVDGNRYIDFVGSWGPLILGHAHPNVVDAIIQTARGGTSFGATTPREVELAERVTKLVPSVEQVRFVNSGTEATMSALRLARGITKRDRVIKFSGGYHGHADAFLTDAGSGIATLGIPDSAGVPTGAAQDSITVPYNDLNAVSDVLTKMGDTVAAIIVEPIACNMGMVQPAPGFLQGLRDLCDKHGALLIFDEVITGFRVARGGAQELYGVLPDLTTFGKIIGGGLPVGAYGGRAAHMSHIAPMGPVYQAGTLSGNPLAMAAGIATLDILSQPGFYENLETKSAAFAAQMSSTFAKHGHPALFCRVGSIFYSWFKAGETQPPQNYAEIKTADAQVFATFFRTLLGQGIYIAPSAFEVGFVSAAHEKMHLDSTVTAVDRTLQIMAGR